MRFDVHFALCRTQPLELTLVASCPVTQSIDLILTYTDVLSAFLSTSLVQPRLFPFPVGLASAENKNMVWESGLQPHVVSDDPLGIVGQEPEALICHIYTRVASKLERYEPDSFSSRRRIDNFLLSSRRMTRNAGKPRPRSSLSASRRKTRRRRIVETITPSKRGCKSDLNQICFIINAEVVLILVLAWK
jgi:hypothetical protein